MGTGRTVSARWPTVGLATQMAVALALCAHPVRAQSEPATQVFTYSTIETDASPSAVAGQIEEGVAPVLEGASATLYAVWTPATFPESAPFVGLSPTQSILMAAWDEPTDPAALESALRALDGVTAVSTKILEPIYLASGLDVPTGAGFYVHREEVYRPGDVDEVVRLSGEAWVTYEPAFGIRVIGLFRERNDSADVAHLLRIAWYRSFDHWTESRQFARDPESLRRFQARGQLQLDGSGTAIATDRLVR